MEFSDLLTMKHNYGEYWQHKMYSCKSNLTYVSNFNAMIKTSSRWGVGQYINVLMQHAMHCEPVDLCDALDN